MAGDKEVSAYSNKYYNLSMDLTTKQVNIKPIVDMNRNPTGKGGFRERPENINPGGRPKNQESFTYWMNYFKNLYVSDFLLWAKNNPEDKRTVAADIAYTRILNSRKELADFREVANRTEGMPRQAFEVKSSFDMTAWVDKTNQILDSLVE